MIVAVHASPERVFEVWRDVERWPEWNPAMTSIRLLSGGPFAVGSKAKIRQPKLFPAVWRVTEFDEPRSFVWVTASPGVKVEARHSVVSAGTGSTVTLTFRMSGLLGGLMARVFGGLTQRYIAIEAEGLRKRCEN
jgi:uncharacterized membrane protein